MDTTRRRLLAAAAGVGIGAGAGCLGDAGGDPGEAPGTTTAQASFFVFGDVASKVAGDAAMADLLVPVGQHGHGWEPGPSVREDIHEADLFVHGMEGFQPWVDDIKPDLEADGSDVLTVDVSRGIDLLEAGEGHDHDDEDDDEHDSDDDDHEEEHHDDDHDGDDDDDHDRGDGMDPHFWMDPLRVEEAVGTVRQGFVDVDGASADAYADNADGFRDRLEGLHERIEATIEEGSRDVVLVAGHDAFQYLGDRYDVGLNALSGLSPDDRPTVRDVERAQEIIESHDLRYICADPLESQQAAEQLVEETSAEEVLPLTALPGLKEEWKAEGWGYVEVMEEVNLPTLERALGA
jgi:zinc transport system substrate-binding protein